MSELEALLFQVLDAGGDEAIDEEEFANICYVLLIDFHVRRTNSVWPAVLICEPTSQCPDEGRASESADAARPGSLCTA